MNKAKKILLIVLVAAAVLAAGGAVVYVSVMPAEEREAMIGTAEAVLRGPVGEKAMTGAAYAAVVIGFLAPVVKRVKKSSGFFDAAVSAIRGTESSSDRAVRELAAWREEMREEQAKTLAEVKAVYVASLRALRAENTARAEEMRGMILSCVERMDADHATVDETREDAERICRMLEIGLCNLPDLVASGNGRRIAEISRGRRGGREVSSVSAASEEGSAETPEGGDGDEEDERTG